MGAPKNIHFFIGQLNIGGIETYLLRIAKKLHEGGITVVVWVVKNSKDAEMYSDLSRYAEVNFIGRFNRLSAIYIKPVNLPDNVDMVVAMGQTSLLSAMRACALLNRPVKLVVGVFSQWEFMSNINLYRNNLINNMFERLIPSNVFFCTDGSRSDHAKVYGKSIYSKVSPLLIDLDKLHNISSLSLPSKNLPITRILSVGRVTPFKTYNYYMPKVVRSLLNKGFNVSWDVYGDGPKLETLKKIVLETETEGHIVLHGTLPYSQLPEKLIQADIYIGAGTSIIEAAAAGLPAIVALDDESDAKSPGFFSDRNGVYTSDSKEGEILFSIESIIESYINSSVEDKNKLSKASRLKADAYSIDRAKDEYNSIYKSACALRVEMPSFFLFLDVFSMAKYFLKNRKLPIRSTHN